MPTVAEYSLVPYMPPGLSAGASPAGARTAAGIGRSHPGPSRERPSGGAAQPPVLRDAPRTYSARRILVSTRRFATGQVVDIFV
jgi:hypothetical protein